MLRSTAHMPTHGTQRILLAHERDADRDALELWLLESGFDVKAAENPAVSLAFARAWAPDAVIVDLRMPPLGAVPLLRALRALASPRTMLIIACAAAHPKTTTIETTLSACCDDIVVLPSDRDALLARLRVDNTPMFQIRDWSIPDRPSGLMSRRSA